MCRPKVQVAPSQLADIILHERRKRSRVGGGCVIATPGSVLAVFGLEHTPMIPVAVSEIGDEASSPGGRLPTLYSTIEPVPAIGPMRKRLNSCSVSVILIMTPFHKLRRPAMTAAFYCTA